MDDSLGYFPIGTVVTHRTKGGKYVVVATPASTLVHVQMPLDEPTWVPGYAYIPIDGREVKQYVRTVNDFAANFVGATL